MSILENISEIDECPISRFGLRLLLATKISIKIGDEGFAGVFICQSFNI